QHREERDRDAAPERDRDREDEHERPPRLDARGELGVTRRAVAATHDGDDGRRDDEQRDDRAERPEHAFGNPEMQAHAFCSFPSASATARRVRWNSVASASPSSTPSTAPCHAPKSTPNIIRIASTPNANARSLLPNGPS